MALVIGNALDIYYKINNVYDGKTTVEKTALGLLK